MTVEKDYAASKYRLYLDGSATPVDNPTASGAWFNMVGTGNAYLSRARVLGASGDVPSYLDDLVVDIEKPAFLRGSVFRFR